MISELQEEVNKLEDFINQHSHNASTPDGIFVLLTHLISEVGEVADEIKGKEGKRAEDPKNYSTDNLAKELVDVIFNVLRIARYYRINLDDFFKKTVSRNI